MEAVDLLDSNWDRLALDSFNFGLINLDSLFEDNITKEDNLKSKHLTLLKFSI